MSQQTQISKNRHLEDCDITISTNINIYLLHKITIFFSTKMGKASNHSFEMSRLEINIYLVF